jgi:hypothetical protein
VAVFEAVDLEFQRGSQYCRLRAIDQHLHAFARVRIGQRIDRRFERQQTAAASDVAPLNDALEHAAEIDFGGTKHPRDQLHPHHERSRRILQHDRAQRSADHDDERSDLQQRGEMTALERLPADDGGQGEEDADGADAVHVA